MFKLYDTAFKIGFVLTAIICLILNIIDYIESLSPERIWGFPIRMTDPFIFSLNVFIIAGIAFVVGLIFKFIWSKFKSKELR